ncbi:MAG: hypothetical protein U1B30_01760, partial [Pseudomonadota bacterium]|nr:hypothetical protein [Pseudomonadota bacterium]
MTFIIQGLNGNEIMPLEKLFKPTGVTEVAATAALRPIDEKEPHDTTGKQGQQAAGEQAYKTIKELPLVDAVLFA